MARLLIAATLRRPVRALAALSLTGASLAVIGCGSGVQTIDDPKLPYSFSYPSGFQSGGQSSVSAREQGFENQTILAKENGQDLIAVQTQPLRQKVTPDLVPAVKREVEQAARRTAKVRSRQDIRVGNLDGVAFLMSLQGTGVPIGARWIYAAKDRSLYWIDCQWQRERTAVLKACDQVVRTFKPR